MTTQTFFAELQRLLGKYPHTPPNVFNSEESSFGDHVYYCKHMFFSFDVANCTNGAYVYDSYLSPSCIDCDYCVESELCYESVDAFKCFNSAYLENCGSTRDSMYAYNCINCANVFGCVNLQNKSFCLFNRQLSEQEYREKVQLYKKWPAEKVLGMVEELKKRYPLTQTNEAHNENSSYGNYVYFNKNCYLCFDAGHNEESAYLYDSFYNKSCFDTTYAAQNNQLSYEIIDSGNLFNCSFAVSSNNCQDSLYLFNCSNVKNCLGCVSLSNKEYCVLNRQLTKEAYESLTAEFLAALQQLPSGWNNLQITA